MEIKINWDYAKGVVDTKDMKLACIPARESKGERDAELCINPPKGMTLSIAEIHTGDIESSNLLCEEIVRRFNEFPEELKR